MTDIIEFLRGRLNEDEGLAQAACDKGTAEHWQWMTAETDQVVPDTELAEALNQQDISLRSVEVYPAKHPSSVVDKPRPSVALWSIDDYTPALPHIAHWDPARVLAEVAFKRDLLVWCERSLFNDDGQPSFDDGWDSSKYAARHFLRSMATLYKSHPDYNPAWVLDAV